MDRLPQHYLFKFLLGSVSSFIVYVIPVLFSFARAYIVIESFISLRRVPVGVYQTPQGNIMGYVPHL
jgi:hypothetical protein